MFKKILKKVGKVLFVISFFLFLAGTIIFAILFLLKLKQYNDLNGLYSQAQENLNKSSQQNQVTIGNLQQSFNDLNTEITKLKSDNADLQAKLDQQAKDGYGEINGKISGQIVVGDNTLSQYQMVCAQNVSNTNLQYCVNVSAIAQNYALVLPAGTYQVFARVLDKNNQVTLNYKASYTEYVKCVTEKAADQCDVNLSKNIINVEVKSGAKVSNVNPIDWSNS